MLSRDSSWLEMTKNIKKALLDIIYIFELLKAYLNILIGIISKFEIRVKSSFILLTELTSHPGIKW